MKADENGPAPSVRIGVALRRMRRLRKMTLEGLADRSGIDPGNISRLENNKIGYSDRTLERLCTALGCEPRALFGATTDADDVELRPVSYWGATTLVPVVALDMIPAVLRGVSDMRDIARIPTLPMIETTARITRATGLAIVQSGDAMSGDQPDACADGDVVVFRMGADAEPGQIVLAQVGDRAAIRKYQDDGIDLLLCATNPRYPSISAEDKPFTTLGVAVEVISRRSLAR